MSAAQVAIGLGAAALVFEDQRTNAPHALASVIEGKTGVTTAAHSQVVALGLEIAGAIVLTLMAGASHSMSVVAAVALAALWVLFFVRKDAATKKTQEVR